MSGDIIENVEIDGIYYNLDTEEATAEVGLNLKCTVSNIVFPKTVIYNDIRYIVNSIQDNAFYGCNNLGSILIPETVTRIGYSAFQECRNLKDINIPNSVISIGYMAFYQTSWYNNQSSGIVYAGKVAYTFKGTMPSNTEIVLKDGTIGVADNFCSNYSQLKHITFPNSLQVIGQKAFCDCTNLDSIIFPDSLKIIDNYAFQGCNSFRSIVIPKSVINIGISAFYNCI